MDIQQAIGYVAEGRDLSRDEMQSVMRSIMQGETTPAQIGGFLVGLHLKGETVNEITAAAEVMRALSAKVCVSGDHLVDTCGTGGDGANTFNISTASAFVAAAAGANVAKHGNRSVSSKSGSADVLEAAGVKLDLSPEQVADCIGEIGIGFMFAPMHHSAMKHAIGPRRELGIRTIFNVLGPLTNPAGTPNQVLGVFSDTWLEPLAQVLKQLGSQHVLVVHSADGMDEISIAAPTTIAELKDGNISTYEIDPEQFNLLRNTIGSLAVSGVEESLDMMQSVLGDQAGPARDIVCLNAGAAIYAADITDDLGQGIMKADETIASGAAREKLDQLVAYTNGMNT
ncbi:MAG: anthranilate phosphoribosyltransferase [Gammaproteobacteria bacterium]